jgi:hypothetical protein
MLTMRIAAPAAEEPSEKPPVQVMEPCATLLQLNTGLWAWATVPTSARLAATEAGNNMNMRFDFTKFLLKVLYADISIVRAQGVRIDADQIALVIPPVLQ